MVVVVEHIKAAQLDLVVQEGVVMLALVTQTISEKQVQPIQVVVEVAVLG
jgi:hypothetical protein